MRKSVEDSASKDAHETSLVERSLGLERLQLFSLRKHFRTAAVAYPADADIEEQEPSRPSKAKKVSSRQAASFQPPGRSDQPVLAQKPQDKFDQSGSPRAQAVAEKLCKRTLQLKAELQACEREAAALRQRLSHLQDRSKEKRRAQWDRRALNKDWGSGAQAWVTWKAFAERSLQEAQRIRRIVGKVPAPEQELEMTSPSAAEQLVEVNAALQRAKSEFEEEQAEQTKLTRALKLGEADARQRRCRHHAEAESIWAEIAHLERDEARMRPEEIAERKWEKKLRQEVDEEKRRLEACPSKVPNERLQRADEAVDIVCMRISDLQQSQATREEKIEKEHRKKVKTLRSECEELKREIGLRKAQQAQQTSSAKVTQATASEASSQTKKESKKSEENPFNKGLPKAERLQDAAPEMQRLEAAKRIQRNVRRWQRKVPEAKGKVAEMPQDFALEQLSIQDTSPQQAEACPSPGSAASPASLRSAAKTISSDEGIPPSEGDGA